MVKISVGVKLRPIVIEQRDTPVYQHVMVVDEPDDGRPWYYDIWRFYGIDVIGGIVPAASNSHKFILVAIDYFTKWVEAASYATLTAVQVAHFIKKNVIYRYGVPQAFVSDNGVHFKGRAREVLDEFQIQKQPPYSLVYDMEAVLPIELEVPNLRTMIECEVQDEECLSNRFEELMLFDERRLRAVYHIQGYQRRIARAFNKKVKRRDLSEGDMVLKEIRAPIYDPRGKFRPKWSGHTSSRSSYLKELHSSLTWTETNFQL
ncbi:uncharacterized protein LOC131299603 [Rhododendron vialii]|uniref:uncharacterized protein LOC131299603 n=1 Tax=Rhododendron vialii TaxID=182163 RepID=UPI0026603780|nr:uncharacterized protein LOC131299603 [Rhododendron vialii]